MARGWESKSVEQQQDEAASKKEHGEVLTPQQIAERQRRQGLELSRQRILQQLQGDVQSPASADAGSSAGGVG